MKFESHITLNRDDAESVKQIIANLPDWKFSQFDADPIMGDKPYCYLTAYDENAINLFDKMEGMIYTLIVL